MAITTSRNGASDSTGIERECGREMRGVGAVHSSAAVRTKPTTGHRAMERPAAIDG
jgi:hypothetical protein